MGLLPMHIPSDVIFLLYRNTVRKILTNGGIGYGISIACAHLFSTE